ncbi:MAG: hypothetical protein JWN44_1989 [Myxococcales bacterium]|nr:hypothetical protein [Myxococcales bacterium]
MELAAVLDSMTDGVFVCDETGRLIAINPVGLCIVGAKDLEEVQRKGPYPFRFLDVRDEEGHLIPVEDSPLARALAGDPVVHRLELIDRRSGERLVLRTRAAPIRGAAGEIVGAVKTVTDVTHEYELERAKEEFIRVAAHELKTPVTIIKANAQAALSMLADAPAGVLRLLEAMVRGADRIDRLIGSLLDLTDLQGGILSLFRRQVGLGQLLREVVEQMPTAAARRIRVVEATPVAIDGDARRLRQMTRSLLDNAVKYSSDKSSIEVSLTRTEYGIRLSVADHGIGIPDDKRERVFEKFFRAHAGRPDDVGGIGVGLFIAREIVKQHGGRIWFESAEGSGTTFYVDLPAAGETA